MMWLITDNLATHTSGLYMCLIQGLKCKFSLQLAWSKAREQQVAPFTPGAVLHCWTASSLQAAQAKGRPCCSQSGCPAALSGWALWAVVVSPSVSLGWLLLFIVIPKTPHWSCAGGKEQQPNGTGRKNELTARSKFLSAYGGIMGSTSGAFHKNRSWFPAPWGTPLGTTAQQHHPPQARICLLARTRFAWYQHPWSLSNPLVWEKRCSPIPILPQQPEFVFPSWSGDHPTTWAQRSNFYISVFHWNSIVFLMAWGQLKFSSCAVEVFSTKRGC